MLGVSAFTTVAVGAIGPSAYTPVAEGDGGSITVRVVNPAFGDFNGDCIVDLNDFAQWPLCVTGPDHGPVGAGCDVFDFNLDNDVDLEDAGGFQGVFGQSKGPPPNDFCVSPAQVGDGTMAFSNLCATTDGPDEPEACDFFDYTHIESDIWFCYQATCTADAVVSLCGSQFDTKLAVYQGCDCPATAPIACSDDDCGVGPNSRVTFAVETGQSYLIRIGGFRGAQGDGVLTILCGADVCGPGNGDCFAEGGNGTRGCDDEVCCTATCEVDPFCCDIEWDPFCVREASGICTGGFNTCVPGAGSCASGHGDGAPGCDDVDCCNTVCMVDPFCCITTWDDTCASEARGLCFLTCGGQSGGCFTDHGSNSPGCDDVACCEAVCAEDSFCCGTTWDQQCADMAATMWR